MTLLASYFLSDTAGIGKQLNSDGDVGMGWSILRGRLNVVHVLVDVKAMGKMMTPNVFIFHTYT